MNADDIARSAQLALLLEVSAYPKPGNVDRTHDFRDTSYEHFIASSVALYPVFRAAAARGSAGEPCVGELVRKGVEASVAWQRGGNTHFGALLLMIPLAIAAGAYPASELAKLQRSAAEIMRTTTVDDAVEVYRAFPKAKVKVRRGVPELDVLDEASIEAIREKQLTLFEILNISASYDLISRELVGGFTRSFRFAALLTEYARERRINDAITHAYLQLLAAEEDTFITLKFGPEKSRYVQDRAKHLVATGCTREQLEAFDAELVGAGLNPGSSADIIAAALFISILRGLRF